MQLGHHSGLYSILSQKRLKINQIEGIAIFFGPVYTGFKGPKLLEGKMIKSELDELLAQNLMHLPEKKVQQATKLIIEYLSQTLSSGNRIEIRGFGSFCLNYRPSRQAFNPKTGKRADIEEKHIPHFKPGKELKEGINSSRETIEILTKCEEE
jgi:integration host factor subunit beta